MVTAIASLVEAAEIMQTRSLSETAVFSQFDSKLGNLNFIKIDVLLNISNGQLYYDNDSSSPTSGTLQFGKVVSLTYTTDVILKDSAGQTIFGDGKIYGCNTLNFSLAADNGDGKYNYDSTSPDGDIFSGTNLAFSDSGYIANSFWNQGTKGFVGTGTYNILYSVSQWINFSGNNINDIEYYSAPAVSSNGCISVTYSYTPAPEPCSFFLISTGFALVINKRQKQKRYFKKIVIKDNFLLHFELRRI